MYAKYINEDISNKKVYIFVVYHRSVFNNNVQQVGLNVYNRKLFNIVQSKNLRLP